MSTQALQEGVSKTVYSTSKSSVPLAVSVDLKEKVQGIRTIYPFLQTEELLNLFPKDPYEVNEAVAKILPQITQFTQHNFGCLVFISVLCTIDGHASLEPTLRHHSASPDISCNFSLVPKNIPQLPLMLKQAVIRLSDYLPLPYNFCPNCKHRHCRVRCPES